MNYKFFIATSLFLNMITNGLCAMKKSNNPGLIPAQVVVGARSSAYCHVFEHIDIKQIDLLNPITQNPYTVLRAATPCINPELYYNLEYYKKESSNESEDDSE
ncbi:MAG: hypothetical protein WCE21_03755 [Candidatus Babeliales bacterium]